MATRQTDTAHQDQAGQSSNLSNKRNIPIDTILSNLSSLLKVSRTDQRQISQLVQKVVLHGERNGFTSSQATHILRIALRSNSSNQTALVVNAATHLVRCIRPARDQQFDQAFVLSILGSLGGNADAGADITGLADTHQDASDIVSIDETVSTSVDHQAVAHSSSAKDAQRKRKTLGVRVQMNALRLLLQLHSPPSIVSWAHLLPSDQAEQARKAALPSSFLNKSAKRALDQCYGVLFHFLDYETLRPMLCHLLCLITQRKHVRHYRIAKILALRARLPLDEQVSALLNTYATFYPDILFYESTSNGRIGPQTVTNHVHGLRYPNVKWLISVHRLWQNERSEDGDASIDSHVSKQRLARPRHYVNGSEYLPFLTPPPSVLSAHETTVLVSEIASAREMGYLYDRLHVPDQYASALSHRMTMVGFLCRRVNANFAASFKRIHEWTTCAMSDQMSLPLLMSQGSLPLQRANTTHEANAALMIGLQRVVELAGCCDERLQTRLYRILHIHTWKKLHAQERKAFLMLLENFAPLDIATFQLEVLEQLAIISRDASEAEAAMIIGALSALLSNWAAQDWYSILRRLERQEQVYLGTMRLKPERATDYVDTIVTTVQWATRLANDAFCHRPTSVLLMHSCLCLHETVLSERLVGLHDLLLPPTFTLYLPVFSQYAGIMGLSRQFGLVYTVRSLHQQYLAAAEDGTASDALTLDGQRVPEAVVQRRKAFFAEESSDRINDCVILLLDLVWRNNGFVSVDGGTVDIDLPPAFFAGLDARCQGRGDELERIGSASHSAMLAVLMEAYANDLARQRGAQRPVLHGPVTPAKLKLARRENFPVIGHRDLRDSFLAWLAQHGAQGLSELLNATITRFIRGQELDQSTVFS